ncbi:DNA polymerase III subunit beta [Planctomicrobium sp. SH668]|uniref:DNA polymerase III subunit beta n=1 Tax=Planctomicrobium sp. SH668 TaxID=3448126 RepID=UPI003F5B0CEF
MKFVMNRQVLAGALSRAFQTAPTKSPKEVLRNVRIAVNEKEVLIDATDEEISIHLPVPAEDIDPGVCLCNQRLQAICRESTSELIEVRMGENGKIYVTAGMSEWCIQTEDPSTFPLFSPMEGDAINIPSTIFEKAVQRTVFATDVATTRYALGGVLIEVADGRMVFAATDGRRLSLHEFPVDYDGPDFLSLIPSKGIRSALTAADGASQVAFRVQKHAAEFASQTATLYARQIEGRFPRYQDVIPRSFNFTFHLVAGPFRSALRQSLIVTTEETRGVDFVFEKGNLTLRTAGKEVGSSRVELPVEGVDTTKVTLNPHYVLDFLKTLADDVTVSMDIVDEHSAVKIGADGTVYIVMPLSDL